MFLLATLLACGNWTVDRENKTLCAYGRTGKLVEPLGRKNFSERNGRREWLSWLRDDGEGFMTLHKMAGNASFSLFEPQVTHEAPTAAQIGVSACSGCERLFRPNRRWQKQCSAGCRQRAYVRRQPTKTVSYYGA